MNKGIDLSHFSEDMQIGKTVDRVSFKRLRKKIDILNIQIDIFDKNKKIIGEVKKTNRMEKAHKIQLLYYLFVLETLGVEGVKGELRYPLLKRKIQVSLDRFSREKVKEIIEQIEFWKEQESPPPLEPKSFCKSCSLFFICFS